MGTVRIPAGQAELNGELVLPASSRGIACSPTAAAAAVSARAIPMSLKYCNNTASVRCCWIF